MFKVVDVTDWQVDDVDEQMGTKEKCWLEGRTWLFKEARERHGDVLGEDWAEKVVEQFARLLTLPVAQVELAVRHGRRGIISKSFVADGARLEHGNELLARIDPLYDRGLERQNERYSVRSVETALAGLLPPDGIDDDLGFTAFDVWSGYLLLDAWVAGRDRHHENWGAVTTGHRSELAPTFDHGNALGFQEHDEGRASMVRDKKRLEAWACRGRSHHFAGKPQLVDLAHQALDLASAEARTYWIDRLADADAERVSAVLEAVPPERMSVPARMFSLELLELNRRRLLHGN